MTSRPILHRRGLLRGAVGLGLVAAAAPAKAVAQGQPLPARGNYLIRDGYVLTMDAGLGDIAGGDVHIRDGEIVAVGRGLAAPGATVIPGRDMIVLPGLVETHWHMWNALLRSMSGDKPEHGYFPTRTALGKVYRPQDMYQGTRLAAAEAIYSGITTVNSWCHNANSPEHALADLQALKDTGIRGRFSLGPGMEQPGVDLGLLSRMHKSWPEHGNGGLLHLALAWSGRGAPPDQKATAVARAEIEVARKLGLPVGVHVSGARGAGQVAAMGREGFLGKDLIIVHATGATADEMALMAKVGTAASLSPFSELRAGYNITETAAFVKAGVTTSFSVDTTALSGNADMFAIMKLTQNIENGRAQNEFAMPARRVLELATIDGAKALGLGDRVGSLAPGKRADVIMVTTRAINMALFTDPVHLLVEAAQPHNVDTVIVDGRILKRGGEFTAINMGQVMADAQAAMTGVRKRANWW